MTPKEKAQNLIIEYCNLEFEIGGQYDGYLSIKIHDAKDCALIAVDEIIKIFDTIHFPLNLEYWQEVKQEIENL